MNAKAFVCASGSPPLTSTRLQSNSSNLVSIASKESFSPPVNVYSLSHQTHRIGQPVSRTKEHGRPACDDSPWIERKISVTRSSDTNYPNYTNEKRLTIES